MKADLNCTPSKEHVVELSMECESTPLSEDDQQRKELLWETREEVLITQWAKDCAIRVKLHNEKSKSYKVKYGVVSIPSILIPIVLSGLSPVVSCGSLEYSLALMSAGLFSGVSLFFNFGRLSSEHKTFADKYFSLITSIESEICKPKRHRIACDVYLEKIKNEYNSLVLSAPDV